MLAAYRNLKSKPALARMQKSTPALFLCLVTLTFDLFDPKINGFPGLMVDHVYVTFVDPCIGF